MDDIDISFVDERIDVCFTEDNIAVGFTEGANVDVVFVEETVEVSFVEPNDIVLEFVGTGQPGAKGDVGEQGEPGEGVPAGGLSGQQLAKIDGTDFNTTWVDPNTGNVDSVNSQTGIVVLDTDDIADTATARYTNDIDISRLANTSGSNSGDQDLSGKQDLLVSGTNIKTVNGSSVLGTGDITISGGSSLIIDTKRNILTSTPVSPSVALSNDTKEYFAYDGTNWNKASLKFNTDSPAPDMGYIQGNDKNGYGNEYIDNKRFTNLAIGQFNEQPYEGAIRYDMSQTPPAFELYARGIWNKIFYDFQMLNGKLEHIPKRYTIAVASGHSTEKGLNGLPYIRGYSVDMGAYPRPIVIDGGQLGT